MRYLLLVAALSLFGVLARAQDVTKDFRPEPPKYECHIVNPELEPHKAILPEVVDALLACNDVFAIKWRFFKSVNVYLDAVRDWRLNVEHTNDQARPRPPVPDGYSPDGRLFAFEKAPAPVRPTVGEEFKQGMYFAFGKEPAGTVVLHLGKRLVKVTSPTPFGTAQWWEELK